MDNISLNQPAGHLRILYTFRELIGQIITWIILYVIGAACGFGNMDYNTQRYNQAIRNFTDEFSKYFGYENAKILESLLLKDFDIIKSLVNNVLSGNQEAIEIDRYNYNLSIEEISDFFDALTDYWQKQEWQKILNNLHDVLQNKINCTYLTQAEAEYEVYDEIRNLTIELADYMSEGIINLYNL